MIRFFHGRQATALSTAAAWSVAVVAPFATHVALATGRGLPVAAGFTGCQLAVILSAAAGRRPRPLVAGAAAGSLALLCTVLPVSVAAGSGFAHAAIYVGLLALFAGTLRPGRTPMVTQVARRVRGQLTPRMEAYARGVTVAWCGFFGAQLAASLGLLLLAPRDAWSFLINVLDAPSVLLMFVAEYAVRRLTFHEEDHAGFMEVLRSVRSGMRPADG